ncbi:WapI family immunity protein [Demequina subtropica]|uniref:WapI family immunity protein n=1 Tax=Demequina subtropica TaxID=1638989 RepID=UPI000782CAFD|nr:hypothetical protein [Demequina subtropica]
MRLGGGSGDSLALRIDRYQFPAIEPSVEDDWDANWLMITGRVGYGDMSWTFREPCLTAGEAVGLGAWLRRVASAAQVGRLEFTEPLLVFSIVAQDDAGVTVRVVLAAESVPEAVAAPFEEIALDLWMSRAELSAAAAAWEAGAAEFPPRG